MPAVSRLTNLAHRYVWQSLPHGWRRRALVAVSSSLAPRPVATPDVTGPLVVAGFLTAASGLGASARLCHSALSEAGLPVMGIDLTAAFRQDASRIDFPFVDGSRHVGGGCLLLHVNAPFVPLALMRIGRAALGRKLVVASWAWELPEVPPEWRAGVRFVHRVLVPSRFTRDAIAAMAPALAMDVLPYAVAGGDLSREPPPRSASDVFTTLVVFNMASGFVRKSPLAAVTAFQQAFGDDTTARLVIKMLNGDAYRPGAEQIRRLAATRPNIELDERSLPPEAMAVLYARADVVMSLHRSEGFGLVVAEAMLAGRPVIATDWSGSTDFLNADNGRPIPARLVPAIDPDGEYHNPRSVWAEADVVAAAAELRRLRGDADLRRRIGMAARDDALRMFSREGYAASLLRLLGLVPGGEGRMRPACRAPIADGKPGAGT